MQVEPRGSWKRESRCGKSTPEPEGEKTLRREPPDSSGDTPALRESSQLRGGVGNLLTLSRLEKGLQASAWRNVARQLFYISLKGRVII